MADNTDWFDDVQAVLDDVAADPVEESAPLLDTTPSADETITAADETSETITEEAVEESTEPAAVVAESAPEPEAKPVVWDSPENPHFEAARKFQQMQQLAQQAQQQAAAKREEERIRALADDDPQRVTELQTFIAEAQRPLLSQMQTKEYEVEMAAKLATVTEEAIRLEVPKELQAKVFAQVERMMRLPGGPDFLRQDIETRQQERSAFDKELAAAKKRIAELERGTAVASQVADRVERRADLVESGSGAGTSLETRWADASNFDEAFDVVRATLPPQFQRTG